MVTRLGPLYQTVVDHLKNDPDMLSVLDDINVLDPIRMCEQGALEHSALLVRSKEPQSRGHVFGPNQAPVDFHANAFELSSVGVKVVYSLSDFKPGVGGINEKVI